jgi:hypothetical protein
LYCHWQIVIVGFVIFAGCLIILGHHERSSTNLKKSKENYRKLEWRPLTLQVDARLPFISEDVWHTCLSNGQWLFHP